MRRHEEDILNYFKLCIDNAAIEGMNNRAKVLSHRCCGFRTAETYITALHHCLGTLPEPESVHGFWFGARKKKGPRTSAEPRGFNGMLLRSAETYDSRLGPFRPCPGFVLDLLTVLQGCVTLRSDVRVMDEKVFASIVGSDETVSLALVKPLHCTSSQNNLLPGPVCIGPRTLHPPRYSLGVRPPRD